jgi:hypothetical protein
MAKVNSQKFMKKHLYLNKVRRDFATKISSAGRTFAHFLFPSGNSFGSALLEFGNCAIFGFLSYNTPR